VLEDVTGAFDAWCRVHPDRDVIVLRPDRYVAAMCTRADFASATRALRARFGDPTVGLAVSPPRP